MLIQPDNNTGEEFGILNKTEKNIVTAWKKEQRRLLLYKYIVSIKSFKENIRCNKNLYRRKKGQEKKKGKKPREKDKKKRKKALHFLCEKYKYDCEVILLCECKKAHFSYNLFFFLII